MFEFLFGVACGVLISVVVAFHFLFNLTPKPIPEISVYFDPHAPDKKLSAAKRLRISAHKREHVPLLDTPVQGISSSFATSLSFLPCVHLIVSLGYRVLAPHFGKQWRHCRNMYLGIHLPCVPRCLLLRC